VRVQAFAKINLSLHVLGRRDDGYHELRTIFQSIALFDTLTIRRIRGPVRLTCSDPALPLDERNLVWRAAEAIWQASGRRGQPRDVAIDLKKGIPVAAGLGGGSSDAAAAMRALASIWRVERPRLPALASTLGADVPYFLEGGTVLGLERGDRLFPLRDHARMAVVLVVPGFGVSTAEAYGWFDADRRRSAEAFPRREAGNDLEAAVAKRHPEIERIVAALRRAGADHAAMSGSGSAVFGLFKAAAAAKAAAKAVSAPSRRVFVTRTLDHGACRRLAAK
jgi:4-diphosphocytidyl-2-C-methyl-D-erythritol kinase